MHVLDIFICFETQPYNAFICLPRTLFLIKERWPDLVVCFCLHVPNTEWRNWFVLWSRKFLTNGRWRIESNRGRNNGHKHLENCGDLRRNNSWIKRKCSEAELKFYCVTMHWLAYQTNVVVRLSRKARNISVVFFFVEKLEPRDTQKKTVVFDVGHSQSHESGMKVNKDIDTVHIPR